MEALAEDGHSNIAAACHAAGLTFLPFAVEARGAGWLTALQMCTVVAQATAARECDIVEVAAAAGIVRSISTSIHRDNARAEQRRLPGPTGPRTRDICEAECLWPHVSGCAHSVPFRLGEWRLLGRLRVSVVRWLLPSRLVGCGVRVHVLVGGLYAEYAPFYGGVAAAGTSRFMRRLRLRAGGSRRWTTRTSPRRMGSCGA